MTAKISQEEFQRIFYACFLTTCSGTSCTMIARTDLKRRIAMIMLHRIAARLRRLKKPALARAAASMVGIPVAIGLLYAPFVWAQSSGAPKPKFEVAAIKPCDPHGDRGTFAGTVSRGGVTLNCSTLETFIR